MRLASLEIGVVVISFVHLCCAVQDLGFSKLQTGSLSCQKGLEYIVSVSNESRNWCGYLFYIYIFCCLRFRIYLITD